VTVAEGGAAPPAGPLTLGRELARKALHVSSATVPIAYAAGAPRVVILALLVALAVVAAAVEVARGRSERARERFLRATGRLLRAHEHHRLSGATWLLASFVIAAALYPRRVAVAAMWGVAVGDASAAIVGRLAARRRLLRVTPPQEPEAPMPPAPTPVVTRTVTPAAPAVEPPATAVVVTAITQSKTLAGSVACFVATLVGALAVARLGVGESLVAALAAALAERPARPLDDNVRVVAAVGAAVLLWQFSTGAAPP